MAKHVLRDARVEMNGVLLSDHVSSVTINTTSDEVEVTGMGAQQKEFTKGLGDGTMEFELFQDYAAGSVDATLWPLAIADTSFDVKVRVTSGAISATNPEYVMTGKLYEYSPISGSVADANTTTVTIRNASSAGITRDVTP